MFFIINKKDGFFKPNPVSEWAGHGLCGPGQPKPALGPLWVSLTASMRDLPQRGEKGFGERERERESPRVSFEGKSRNE